LQRNAIIFHGTGARPEYCWYPWLGAKLQARGYAVDLRHYPGLNVEPIETFLPAVLANHDFHAGTVLVGHSGGAALLLAVLEHIDVQVAQAILVAGYSTRPNENEEPVLQAAYDWERIKAHVRDAYFVNSVDDPYGCDAAQGRSMFDRVGGTQIIRDEGHFGDVDDPYERFELLDRLID
jgi:predicted alpha/beta hydrolase family esterase